MRLLVSGEDAYGALTALADNAERTLDLQYYLIRGDGSGRALMAHVRSAAERGVRVRLLIDDLNTSGEDARMLLFTRHPNIEVRLYNPFPSGRFSTISRVITSLTDVSRINHRMHNKMFVADNALAITGGRNVGDAYFVHSASSNFVDLDAIVAGNAVLALSKSFDKFWNNPLAYPVGEIVGPLAVDSALAADAPSELPEPLSDSIDTNQLAVELKAGKLDLAWAPATVLADQPSKILAEGEPEKHETVADEIAALMRSTRSELIVISPYFVPGQKGMALFAGLAEHGVKLRVLTNSLVTTDAPVVHIGYAKYRKAMLELGTELYELRPRLGATKSRLGSFGSSQASLHAKALVFDRQTVLIGSMNMDPRSANLNSEIGLVIRSRRIAAQLVQLFEDVGRAGSYRVELTPDNKLRWSAEAPDDGRPLGAALATGADAPAQTGTIVTDDEPEATAWLKFSLKLLAPFAPEEML
ncbi:phospholipase D family protein [soil metagenome]